MQKQKVGYLITGFIMGMALMMALTPISAATDTITAFLRPGFQFFFDEEAKPLPEGQTVLVYEGRSYVPARFVAENLGAEVIWDDVTKSIFITSPEPVIEEPEEVEEEPEEEIIDEPEEEPEEDLQPSGNYLRLPVVKRYRDFEIGATFVALRDQEYISGDLFIPATRIYIELENKQSTPLQIRQGETKAIVDGKEYFTSDVSFSYRDDIWYRDVRKDQIAEGYLVIPDIPKDAEKMKLFIEILENDFRQNTQTIELDILLDLN